MSAPTPTTSSAVDRRAQFESVFPALVDELLAYMKSETVPEDAVQWYKRVSRGGEQRVERTEWCADAERAGRRIRSSSIIRPEVSRTLREEVPALTPNARPNPLGKLNRGMSVVDTVEILNGAPLTSDEYFKAALLGWCVELVRATGGDMWLTVLHHLATGPQLQAYFLVADDMMDQSITRRGHPCWYRMVSPRMPAYS